MSTGRSHHCGHLLQFLKESLQSLTLYTSFHDLNVYSHRSGADNPRGQNFDVYRNLLSLWSFATSFKKISSKSDLIQFFFVILHMYTAPGQGWQPLGNKIFMSTGTSYHFGHLLQVSKKSLWSLILYIFFMTLYMYKYIAPWQGQTAPTGQSSDLNRNVLTLHSFVASLKIISSKSDFIQFFHDLIHVHSPRAGADSPQGTNFWCQQNGLITLPTCCKFQRNLFEVWFYTIVFMI